MSFYPCPCCGHLVHEAPPGSFQICPVCGWEDDLVQLRWPVSVALIAIPLSKLSKLTKNLELSTPSLRQMLVLSINPGRWSLVFE